MIMHAKLTVTALIQRPDLGGIAAAAIRVTRAILTSVQAAKVGHIVIHLSAFFESNPKRW